MYWQEREIYRRASIADVTATYVIDLPRANILSAMVINVNATNGATAGDKSMFAMISKIEVIADGSKEIYSLTGEEAYLASFALLSKAVPGSISLSAGAVQAGTMLIPFGRYMGDPDYYLNCAQYTSLELRITFNGLVAATGIVAGSLYLEVVALMAMEGAPAPKRGTLKTSRKFSFTTVASGDYVMDMPRANPYRRILICAVAKDTDVEDFFSRASFDVNNGEKVIYAGRPAGLRLKNVLELKQDVAFSETAATPLLAVAMIPRAVGDVLTIPFDTGGDMSFMLNSAAYDKISLTLTQSAAAGVIRVILQESLT